MGHSKHLWRAGLILLLAGAGVVVGRQFLIPKSFGENGHYRADSLRDYMELPVRHGGRESCFACHKKDDFASYPTGKHQTVSCEVCHGPVSLHAKDKEKIAAAPHKKGEATYAMCMNCHQVMPSRPAAHKQIDAKAHLEKQEVPLKNGEVPPRSCFKCHDPHDPLPSE